jgi:hypothetical protein
MRADGKTIAISTTVAMQATVRIDVSLSLLTIHLVAVFIFFASKEDFSERDDIAAKWLVAQWWGYGLYVFWF